MRPARRHLLAVIAVAGAAVGLGGQAAGADRGRGDQVPSRLLVTAREYSLSLSRPKVEAGPAIVQLYDYGEDPHNLVLQRVGGPTAFSTGEIEPGETGEVRLRLRRGSRYRLWCSLADHAQLGMTARLRTTKR